MYHEMIVTGLAAPVPFVNLVFVTVHVLSCLQRVGFSLQLVQHVPDL